VEAISLRATDERVSYCGLYCGCCVMEEARVLSDALRKRIVFFGKYEDQVPELRGNWRCFMKVLEIFSVKNATIADREAETQTAELEYAPKKEEFSFAVSAKIGCELVYVKALKH